VTVQQAPPRPKRTYNFAPSIPIKSNVGSDTKGKAREVDVDDGMDVAGDGDETFEAYQIIPCFSEHVKNLLKTKSTLVAIFQR
jgi:hypothetical protein